MVLLVHVGHVGHVSLMEEVGRKWGLPMPPSRVHLGVVVHVVDVLAIIEIVILLGHIIIVLPWLLVPTEAALQVALAYSKDHISARIKKLLVEKLVLFKHFEVTAKCKQAITTGLMLGADSIASNFIAQFSKANILQSWHITDDILEIEHIGKVFPHLSIELVNA